MTFIICLALSLNFMGLFQHLKERNYWWTALSVGAIIACLVGLAGCTTATPSNSTSANHTIQMRHQ